MNISCRFVRRLAGGILLSAVLGVRLRAAEETSPWRMLFAFGDSYTDSGAGYVDGNGPTAIVYVARDLGIPFTHAADQEAANKGLNFAVSGAQTGEGEGRRIKDSLLGRGMRNQALDFVARVQSGAVKFDPERTLFFIAGGLNDRRLETATTLANLSLIVRRLHAVGARHFLIGMLPVKIPSFAEVGLRLNPAIATLPEVLKAEFTDSDIRLSHWGQFMDAVLSEPARHGITNTEDACAGRALFDEDATPRGDPATYFYYHQGHPSTAVQRIVANDLRREVLAAVFPEKNSTPAPADRIASAIQWQRWEGALTAQKEHLQPYATVNVDVRFTGPDGATLQVPAFWDGDRGFRIRAALPAPGVWRWQTTCNDATDAGLHRQTGEVRVTAYSGKNPFYRHGDLRVSANQRFLVHADGTPFLWMGDTGWNIAWKSTAPEWQEYVDTRARQRFSVLHIVTTGTVAPNSSENPPAGHAPFLDDGTPNPPFWRDLDEKLAYANDRGLAVLLVGLGKSPSGFASPQRPPAFARYVAGRFAGHMVILSPSMDQRYEEQNDESGTQLHTLTTHLVTQHPGTHYETIKRYHDAGYADFCGLQSGHRNGNLNLAYQGAREWTLELWQRPPVKPVINLEAMYDAHGHDNAPNWREQDVRKLGWITWLSGSRGYTYGAGDIPPKVPGGAGGIWNFQSHPSAYDHWRKAILWPSASQMTHLCDFFAGIEWWRLEPAPELVKNQPGEQPRKRVVSRSPAGDLLVAYLPDNREISLDLSPLSDGLAGRWFNPVTGTSEAVNVPITSQPAVTLPKPAGWADAVLVLTKTLRPSS